jgi:hypothetical protein
MGVKKVSCKGAFESNNFKETKVKLTDFSLTLAASARQRNDQNFVNLTLLKGTRL